jgi:hypothetical protein
VHAVQTATNPRREAVRKGIATQASGHGSKYWLGTLLVCGKCGSNYIGDGRRDYVCPAHTAGHCDNNLRFRREDAHIAVFDLLKEQVLSERAIARGKSYVEAVLKEREQQGSAAAKDAESGVDVSRLDKEAADVRAMGLRPAALAAGLAEIEKERAELLAKAGGKRDQKDGRARQLLARMPDLVRAYRAQVQRAIAVLTKPEAVDTGREAMRRMLEEGRITLAPNPSFTAVAGPVYLKELGEHVLELAGLQRRCKPSGSGGRYELYSHYALEIQVVAASL